jgi:rSAM/selenodomain-associated transferase 1
VALLLTIVARLPQEGRVKSRLIPAIGAGAATRLHHCMVEEILTQSFSAREQLADEGIDLRLRLALTAVDCDPLSHPIALDWRDRYQIGLSRQSEGGLGERLIEALSPASMLEGALGADAPDLAAPRLIESVTALLAGSDLVIVPATDGGYVLLGLREPEPLLFESISWGSEQVLAETIDRAAQAGLPPLLFDPVDDIDRPEDLDNLSPSLQQRLQLQQICENGPAGGEWQG